MIRLEEKIVYDRIPNQTILEGCLRRVLNQYEEITEVTGKPINLGETITGELNPEIKVLVFLLQGTDDKNIKKIKNAIFMRKHEVKKALTYLLMHLTKLEVVHSNFCMSNDRLENKKLFEMHKMHWSDIETEKEILMEMLLSIK